MFLELNLNPGSCGPNAAVCGDKGIPIIATMLAAQFFLQTITMKKLIVTHSANKVLLLYCVLFIKQGFGKIG